MRSYHESMVVLWKEQIEALFCSFFTFDETTSVSQTDRSREADEMASHALVSSPVSRTERPPVRCIYVSELHSQSLPNWSSRPGVVTERGLASILQCGDLGRWRGEGIRRKMFSVRCKVYRQEPETVFDQLKSVHCRPRRTEIKKKKL